ncbi:MAG: ELM1/GtrOC1 family putative glycosyltransferase, partial [Pseudomonadota bacterium]
PESGRWTARANPPDAPLPHPSPPAPRSPDGAGALLRARIGARADIYDWKAAQGQDNPYRAWLQEADSFLISGDSVSVLSDAVATGRPVTVLPVPKPRWLSAVTATRIGRRWMATGGNAAVLAPPPNLDAIFADLIDKGLADRRGEKLHLPNALPAVVDDHAQAVQRVLALLREQTGNS